MTNAKKKKNREEKCVIWKQHRRRHCDWYQRASDEWWDSHKTETINQSPSMCSESVVSRHGIKIERLIARFINRFFGRSRYFELTHWLLAAAMKCDIWIVTRAWIEGFFVHLHVQSPVWGLLRASVRAMICDARVVRSVHLLGMRLKSWMINNFVQTVEVFLSHSI